VATASPRVAVKPIFFQLLNVQQHREEFLKNLQGPQRLRKGLLSLDDKKHITSAKR